MIRGVAQALNPTPPSFQKGFKRDPKYGPLIYKVFIRVI